MRTIRNITNGAVALGVAKTYSTIDVLSQLKDDSWLKKERVLLSKKEWAKHLNICEMTVVRWEQNIITPNRSFRVNYWDMKGDIEKLRRFNSGQSMGYRLDYFQRFVLATIRVIKVGGFSSGVPKKYDHEVINWLERSPTGQEVRRLFDRDLFHQSTNQSQRETA